MKRSELIKELSEQCNVPKIKTKEIITALTEIITRELINGNKVNIDRLGSFTTVEYTGRRIVSIEGKNRKLDNRPSPRFIPSQTLKNEIKKGAIVKNKPSE